MNRALKLLFTVLILTMTVNYANAAVTFNMDKKVIPINAFYKGNTSYCFCKKGAAYSYCAAKENCYGNNGSFLKQQYLNNNI